MQAETERRGHKMTVKHGVPGLKVIHRHPVSAHAHSEREIIPPVAPHTSPTAMLFLVIQFTRDELPIL